MDFIAVKLKNGETVFVRPLIINDVIRLQKMYNSLSKESKLLFHPPMFQKNFGLPKISQQLMLIFSCFPLARRIFLKVFPRAVIIALVVIDKKQDILGFTYLQITGKLPRYGYAARAGTAVRDDYQGKGLGYRILLKRKQIAVLYGVQKISVGVLAQNTRMIHLARKIGYKIVGKKREIFGKKSYNVLEAVLNLKNEND